MNSEEKVIDEKMSSRLSLAELKMDYPKEVILKDGTGVTLRPLKSGDENALFEMFKRFSKDELWFLNHDVSDPRLFEEWVNSLDSNRVVSIVAILEGRIISNAALMVKQYGAKSHIGKVRIAVDPAFREKRLGTWMLLDLVNVAMSIGLKTVVMRLVEERDASLMSAVRKLDFTEEAVLEDYVLDRGGNPCNLVIMTKRLPTEWDQF
jgi:ribosomal protein S18 acetylase RimI-like enzyme